MRLRLLFVAALTLAACKKDASNEASCAPAVPQCPDGDPTGYVDPMIGTKGPGNVVPGASVPHGMVKLSPDTDAPAGSVDAYDYDHPRIQGFSHTHLEGPGGGANGYSQVLLLPTTGPLRTQTATYASTYDHAEEIAEPGYYAVRLADYDVRAELTATAHAGVHRYTYPEGVQGRLLFDLGHSRGDSLGGEVRIEGARIEGFGHYSVHPLLTALVTEEGKSTGLSTVYFSARLDVAPEGHGVWRTASATVAVSPGVDHAEGPDIGAWVDVPAGAEVVVKVGISFVSVAQARKNLEEEVGASSFDEVRAAAREAWRCRLARVAVEGGTEAERRQFYTAVYHTLLHPADYTEAGGVFFSAADGVGRTFTWPERRFYTDDWCAWDTFRTSRPLATLIEPETVDDVMTSYLHLYEQGGWLPKCTWHATGYSRVMIGNHAVPILADAMSKGFGCFDHQTAWAAAKKSAMQEDMDWLLEGVCGYFNLGTPPEYRQKGYVSHECDPTQSASMTLEYAYNDWTTAQIAGWLAQPEEADLRARARNYTHHYDPETGFMRARHADGEWVEDFDPTNLDDFNDFAESTAWTYLWSVPHDVSGLISLMGGEAPFVAKLDRFFTEDLFDPSNEPGFHAPYLYNYAGEAAKTQALTRDILATAFSDGPGGLPGNDDAGATSAWYVFTALGLYPVAPGEARYQITTPLFPKAQLSLHPRYARGAEFVVRAQGLSDTAIYIQSATLDGVALERTWITHQEITEGGELVLVMGDAPSSWPR